MIRAKIFVIWLTLNCYFGIWMSNLLIAFRFLNNINVKIYICTIIITICEILLMEKICLKDISMDYKITNTEDNDNDYKD